MNKIRNLILFISCYFVVNSADQNLFERTYYDPAPPVEVIQEWIKNLKSEEFYFVKKLKKDDKKLLQKLIEQKVQET